MQVLYKHVRGEGGLKEMLILLMWLGDGVGGLEAKCFIAYVKDKNS